MEATSARVLPGTPGDIYLGRKTLRGQRTDERLPYGGPLHMALFGPSGVGKGMRMLAPNLLTIHGKSIVVIDPKGQLAVMTAMFRKFLGDDVHIIDPFGVVADIIKARPDRYAALAARGLDQSSGFNPLAGLDPRQDAKTFYDDAKVLAEALIKIEGSQPHFPQSAQGLVTGLIMWECELAHKEGRAPDLENVRVMLTEPDQWEVVIGADGKRRERQVAGLRVTADRLTREGSFEVRSLAARFAAETQTEEISGVRSTAETQTDWMLSRPMRADTKKTPGVDFRKLRSVDRNMTVYIVLPAEYLETHSVWLRLVVSEALRAAMATRGRRALMILDEFPALGFLSIVQKLWGVTRDYGVQMWAVLQDLPQMMDLYPHRWQTLLSSTGVVQFFRTGDMTTAEWASKRSLPSTAVALGYNETRNDGRSIDISRNTTKTQIEQRMLKPHDFFGMRDEYTIAYLAGEKAPARLYMPMLQEWEATSKYAFPNPYHEG